MSLLQVDQLSKTYRGNQRPAVHHATFTVADGTLLALVGESGSGKTTLLRILAGLETPDHGTVTLAGNLLSAPGLIVPPERRGIGMVFQHHALFPHLTVEKNIAFGIRYLSRTERSETISNLLDLIGLPGFAKRYPHQLSGGERQRVALARALAPRPQLLLLDEPFSSLDARLRQSVRDETRAVLKQHGTTAIFVTHDTSDALTVADEIIVLRDGLIQQTGTPSEIYHSPVNPYVATFFGDCNFIPTGHWTPVRHIAPTSESGVWIRPEQLELAPPHTPGATLTGTVSKAGFRGTHHEVILECHCEAHGPFTVTVHHRSTLPVTSGKTFAIRGREETA
ncbi:MAG: ABC transporter ATP-binding protein [Luteolibacter sp.]